MRGQWGGIRRRRKKGRTEKDKTAKETIDVRKEREKSRIEKGMG